MKTTGCLVRQCSAIAGGLLVSLAYSSALAQPEFAIFLDSYPRGSLHLVELPDLEAPKINTARSERLILDLPKRYRRKFQVANGDVYSSGGDRTIVFGGRTGNNASWDIYVADVNVVTGVLEDIRSLVADRRVRDEDPRFAWDGLQIVYKCDGKICLVNSDGTNAREIVAKDGCELWAPALDSTGFVVTYVERCNGPESDRVVWHAYLTGERSVIDSDRGGPDRFPYFTPAGEIVYSHVDNATATASLWLYTHPGYRDVLHDETGSDDDPYVYRNDGRFIAFSGWGQDAYDLFIYRRDSREAAQLTQGVNVLGTILFD